MKYIPLILLLFVPLAFYSQEKNYILSGNQASETKHYIARDYIELTNGFEYEATPGKSFIGEIDPTLLFPPTEGTYKKPDGSFTTNPAEGAVVGSIPGQFAVSPTGAATYTIPIEVPAGINGVQPNISLVYNSQSGNGIAGWGWSIGGLSMIARSKFIAYYDGRDSCVVWDSGGPLVLDGERLIKIAETADSVEYRTANESYARIVGYDKQSWGPNYFKVYTKGGVTMTFGNPQSLASYALLYSTPETNAVSETNYVRGGWCLVEIKDNNGNYMTFEYQKIQGNDVGNVIKSISYGANKVRNNAHTLKVIFNYELRPDYLGGYVSGYRSLQQLRLTDIQLSVNNQVQNKYKLNYDTVETTISRLASVDYFIGNNKPFNPLVFSYGTDNEEIIEIPLASQHANRAGIVVLDIDGDGINEIGDIYVDGYTFASSTTYITSYMNVHKSDNWQSVAYTFPLMEKIITDNGIPYITHKYKDLIKPVPAQFGDFNGDNVLETVYSSLTPSVAPMLAALSVEIKDRINYNTLYSFGEYTAVQPSVLTGNFYGNTLSSVLIVFMDDYQTVAGGYAYRYCIIAGTNSGNPFRLPVSPNSSNYYYLYVPKKITSVEIANFGANTFRDDIFVVFSDGTNGIIKNNLSGNQCFTNTISEVISLPFSVDQNAPYQFVDLNQDGFLDIVFRINPSTSFVAYNRGNYSFNLQYLPISFSQETDTLEHYPLGITKPRNLNEEDMFYFVDINGDGLLDIVVADEVFKDYEDDWSIFNIKYTYKKFDKTIWRYYIRKNNTYILQSTWETSGRTYYYNFGDFYSNGSNNWIDANSSSAYIEPFDIRTNKNLLTKVTDGLQNESIIEYKSLSGFTEYDEFVDNDDNINTHQSYISNRFHPFKTSDLLLVSKVSNDLSTVSYHYGKALSNWTVNGFMGFRYFGVYDETKGIGVLNTNRLNSTYNLLLPLKTETFLLEDIGETFVLNNNAPISKTQYDYSTVSLGNKRYSLTLDQQNTYDFINEVESDNYYIYDGMYGNLNQSITFIADAYIEVQDFSYKKVAAWCENLVDKATVTRYSPDFQEQYTRKTVKQYDSRGNIIRETVDPFDPDSVVIQYQNYNELGHCASVSVSANGITRTNSVQYTPSGRFVLSETDVLGQQTVYNWNENKGLLNSKTDAYGTTVYSYNDLNIPTEIRGPDGIRATKVLRWAGSSAFSRAKYYSYSQTSGTAPMYIWYDKYGREIQKDTYGFDNKKISVNITYNSKGLVEEVYEPYYEHIGWDNLTTYSYDEYNRIKSVENNNTGDIITYIYNGLETTIISSGDTVVNLVNQIGQTIFNQKNGKLVEYEYHLNGQPRTVTPQGGQPLTMEYNLQGRRTKLIDPDAGTILTHYNGFGELLWAKQAIHKSSDTVQTAYNYHSNGLLRSKVRTKQTSTGTVADSIVYTYDAVNHYRLTDIEIMGKNRQSFTYGAFDRVIQMDETVEGKPFTFRAEYDYLGRLKKYYYPTGYYAVNHFDRNGYVTKITDRNNRNIWQPLEVNALGQIERELRGNVETEYGYDSRHRLSSITAPGIQDMHFNTSATGNLNYRIDNFSGQREDFVYDAQNRLTDWKITRKGQTFINSITYDNSGNIKTKTDLGGFTMNYGEKINKPHALTSISGVPDVFPHDSLIVTYTDFRKMETLTEGKKHYALTYGVDNQRRKSVYKENNIIKETRYYLGNYEEKINHATGITEKIHYICGAIFIQSNGNDTLYYAYTDNQGSLIALVREDGTVAQRYAYDPWGKRRNPLQWEEPDERKTWIINRGYTGHEHLDAFGIINMNGRVYDPLTAQFFSPDPFIQNPGDWLNYNRYSYCFNNPLRYTDPSGNVAEVTAAVIIATGLNILFSSTAYAVIDATQGKDFVQSFTTRIVVSVVTSLFSSVITTAIGDAFGAVGSVGKELIRAGAHGIGNGLVNKMQGGTFKAGFCAGFFGSIVGSAFHGQGDLTAIMSGLGGALGAYIGGGDPLTGFMQGLSIGYGNHCSHDEWTYETTVVGEGYYSYTKTVISNDATRVYMQPLAPPTMTGVTVKPIDVVQYVLDVAGLVPVIGEPADGINAVIYAFRGDWLNAGLSATAMIPVAGWLATGGKVINKGYKGVNKTVKKADYIFANKSDAMNWGRTQLGHNTDKMYDASGKWIGWSNSKGSVYWGHGDWGKGIGSSTFPHLNYNINGTKGHLFLQDKIINKGMWNDFKSYGLLW